MTRRTRDALALHQDARPPADELARARAVLAATGLASQCRPAVAARAALLAAGEWREAYDH